jgi:hypothetical protein
MSSHQPVTELLGQMFLATACRTTSSRVVMPMSQLPIHPVQAVLLAI